MIIDCHGHYTTAPKTLFDFHRTLIDAGSGSSLASATLPTITDDEIRESIDGAQVRLQDERGVDATIFSPQASTMGHDLGGPEVSLKWTQTSNDLIARVIDLYPDRFIGVAQLPQSPGVSPATCVPELRRTVEELGFVGCNLNPDPTGGYWTDKPLTDEWWYPLYEVMEELDVPAMVHVSGSHNPNFQTTGGYYLAADTTVFMQFLTSDLFERFPNLRFVIPHGGGAVPFHWGRYRGMSLDLGKGELEEGLMRNVFFDTCVYHQPGIQLLTDVVPTKNVIFGSEIIGAVRGDDPRTGRGFDDTGSYLDALTTLTEAQRADIYENNARRVYPRIEKVIDKVRDRATGKGVTAS